MPEEALFNNLGLKVLCETLLLIVTFFLMFFEPNMLPQKDTEASTILKASDLTLTKFTSSDEAAIEKFITMRVSGCLSCLSANAC